MKYLKTVLLLCVLIWSSVGFSQVQNVSFKKLNKRISQSNDTTYIVNFWATWCKPCIEELPDFQQTMLSYSDQPVRFIYVSLDFPGSEDRIDKFISKKNFIGEFFLLSDTNPNEWIDNVNPDWEGNIPATLIVNEQKNVNYFHSGTLSSQNLSEQIDQTLNKR